MDGRTAMDSVALRVRGTCLYERQPHTEEASVQQVHDGQCGLCLHFGESHPRAEQLVSIRKQHQAPEVLVDECGHPRHASLHLKVTPISGCDGFERAMVM